jgi:voltage-gated potassium channel Kch
MSRTTTALFVGLVLGLAAAFGTFGSFVIVLLFGAIGLVVGLVLDGRLDLAGLLGRATAKR